MSELPYDPKHKISRTNGPPIERKEVIYLEGKNQAYLHTHPWQISVEEHELVNPDNSRQDWFENLRNKMAYKQAAAQSYIHRIQTQDEAYGHMVGSYLNQDSTWDAAIRQELYGPSGEPGINSSQINMPTRTDKARYASKTFQRIDQKKRIEEPHPSSDYRDYIPQHIQESSIPQINPAERLRVNKERLREKLAEQTQENKEKKTVTKNIYKGIRKSIPKKP